jgi:hypothetical protein
VILSGRVDLPAHGGHEGRLGLLRQLKGVAVALHQQPEKLQDTAAKVASMIDPVAN